MKGSTVPHSKRTPETDPPSNERLSIGFVLDDSLDPPDGVQQYVLTTGEWLRSKGHDVHYLVSTTKRRDVPNLHDMASNVLVSFNGNRVRTPFPADREHIRSVLMEHDFDVLHVQMPYSPVLAGRVIAAAGSKMAVVGTFHILPRSRLVALASRLLAVWCRRSLERFDAVMSVSPAAQLFARRAFGIESSVLPNPVAALPFRKAKQFAGHDPSSVNILFVGRLVPRKGVMRLLHAVQHLREHSQTAAFVLTICGKGPLEERLKRYVRVHHMEQYVRFKGFVTEEQKRRYYASADITIFPSTGGESFGIVLVEAMASGHAAVLAGDNPGYRFVLKDCPGDVLFDPFKIDTIAAKLKQFIDDSSLRAHAAAWQRHHADHFDISRVGPEILKVYSSALRTRRSMR